MVCVCVEKGGGGGGAEVVNQVQNGSNVWSGQYAGLWF